jgi:hypothetical protein
MGYRRHGETRRAWQKWVEEHRDTLVSCSLPEFVYSDDARWFRFVEHGGWDQESGWTVSMLSPHQAATLYDFIESHYGSEDCRWVLKSLDEVCRKPSAFP